MGTESALSAQMLEKILDRTHLAEKKPPPYSDVGVGYEIVHHAEGSGERLSLCSANMQCPHDGHPFFSG